MKKMMYFTILFASLSAFYACDDETVIKESDLPAVSREFLKTHFDSVSVVRVEKETEGWDKEYSVRLANGFELDFNKSGEWKGVDGKHQELPQSVVALLPAGISQYVSTSYPTQKMVEVDKERHGYDIELSGGVDLDFSASGELIRVDY